MPSRSEQELRHTLIRATWDNSLAAGPERPVRAQQASITHGVAGESAISCLMIVVFMMTEDTPYRCNWLRTGPQARQRGRCR